MTGVPSQPGPDDDWLQAYRTPVRRAGLAHDGVAAILKAFALVVAVLAVAGGIVVANSAPAYSYGLEAANHTGLGIAVGIGGLVTALFIYVAGHAIGLLADAAQSLRVMQERFNDPAERP